MKTNLINQILATGNQFPKHKLEELNESSLKMIFTLRREYTK